MDFSLDYVTINILEKPASRAGVSGSMYKKPLSDGGAACLCSDKGPYYKFVMCTSGMVAD